MGYELEVCPICEGETKFDFVFGASYCADEECGWFDAGQERKEGQQ